jgi:hypothetical protein
MRRRAFRSCRGGFIQRRVVYSVPSGLMATGSMSASTTIASIASSAPHLS